MPEKKLIVVLGPTASGKTGLAIRLAQHLNTEIISADSRQVYKELNIGTAKPSREELMAAKHHLIGNVSITQEYNAGTYAEEAQRVMGEIFVGHDWAILCGGSGLYIKAVLEGFDEMPKIDSGIREGVISEYQEKGLDWLQEQVAEQDPDFFEEVDRQNPQRLMRALEIIRSTGKPFSGFRKATERQNLPYTVLKVGLEVAREQLYKRIDDRMDKMIQAGLFEEGEQLKPFRDLNALQTVGYQEVFGFLNGKYDRDEAIRLLKRNSRRYAKRQMTWFRKDPGIKWINPDNWQGILDFLNTGK